FSILHFASYCFLFTTTVPAARYPLSLHDALPIWLPLLVHPGDTDRSRVETLPLHDRDRDAGPSLDLLRLRVRVLDEDLDLRILEDRKSTRLNSSHVAISYAVFCLKKKKTTTTTTA